MPSRKTLLTLCLLAASAIVVPATASAHGGMRGDAPRTEIPCTQTGEGAGHCSPRPCQTGEHVNKHDFRLTCNQHGKHIVHLSIITGTVTAASDTALTVQKENGFIITLSLSTTTPIVDGDGAPITVSVGDVVRVVDRVMPDGTNTALAVEVLPGGDNGDNTADGTPVPTDTSGDATSVPDQQIATPTASDEDNHPGDKGRLVAFEATVVSFDGTTLVVQGQDTTVTVNLASTHISLRSRPGAPAALAAGERVEVYARIAPDGTHTVLGVVILPTGQDDQATATVGPQQPVATATVSSTTTAGTMVAFQAKVLSFDGTTLVVQGEDNSISFTITSQVSIGSRPGAPTKLAAGERVQIYARIAPDGTRAIVGVVILPS